MNLEKIRNMNDNELKTFINEISQRNNIFCTKCGNIISPQNRKNIIIGIYDKKLGQKTKKLCSLCSECYVDLLDYLSVSDIDW